MNINSPRRGRPRDPDRMKRLLTAATKQFLEYGFERASMDTIAKASDVSKMTIYNYFPSKEALFEAVVGEITDGALESIPPEDLDPLSPEIALSTIGKVFLKLKRSDNVVGSFRLMYAAAGQHPEACKVFYRQGPEKITQQVADYLRMASSEGSLIISSPEVAADQFLSLFLGGADIRVMLGMHKPTEAEDNQLLNRNVTMFLGAYKKN